MIDEKKLRAFAQKYTDMEKRAIFSYGRAAADRDIAQADVARELLAMLDGRCDECDPSFSCFADPKTCSKKPLS